jgi:hypothetical protein
VLRFSRRASPFLDISTGVLASRPRSGRPRRLSPRAKSSAERERSRGASGVERSLPDR